MIFKKKMSMDLDKEKEEEDRERKKTGSLEADRKMEAVEKMKNSKRIEKALFEAWELLRIVMLHGVQYIMDLGKARSGGKFRPKISLK